MIKIHLNSCFSTDFLLFPSSKTQSWPVGLVVMMVVGIGYLAVRNQSRSLYTVITFPNPHAKFPFASSSSFSSTFPLPWSLSPPLPLPLLCFHFLLLSLIFDPAETLRLQFLQLSQLSAVYIPFSTVSYPTLQPLVSPPCPLLLLLDYSPRLTLLWHTLSSQMKETLSDCFRGVWSLTRAHCASVCVFFFPPTLVWNIEDEGREQTGSICSEPLEKKNQRFVYGQSIHSSSLTGFTVQGQAIIMQPWHGVN